MNIDHASQIVCSRGTSASAVSLRFTFPDIKTASLYHLRGRSGTGKSSLLACLAGLLPFQGDMSVFGSSYSCEVASVGCQQLFKLSTALLQRHVVDPDIPVEAHAMFVPFKKEFEQYLTVFDLDALRKKKGNEMSMGQQQRLGLAVVLSQEAKLVLLDEPTAHQDIQYTKSIADIVSGLVAAGKTVVFSSHDAEFVESFGHSIVPLDHVVQVV